jgi:hypothetical protein
MRYEVLRQKSLWRNLGFHADIDVGFYENFGVTYCVYL